MLRRSVSKKWRRHFKRVDKVFCRIDFASYVGILADAKGFAPAGATKGLSDRPLETFGPHTL